jgi:hypothetical protein
MRFLVRRAKSHPCSHTHAVGIYGGHCATAVYVEAGFNPLRDDTVRRYFCANSTSDFSDFATLVFNTLVCACTCVGVHVCGVCV